MSAGGRNWAIVGLILSYYALYVENKIEHKGEDEEFTALCDIESIGASCSAVFQLPEGRMLSLFGIVPSGHKLDIPNAAIGVAYYGYWIFLQKKFPTALHFLFCTLAMSASIFLAGRLIIIKELCVLCWSNHIINARLWWVAYSALTQQDGSRSKVKEIKRV